jgi:hypothetical protein
MEDTLKDRAPIRGFFRLQIENPDGSVAGDTGYCENTITNDGYNDFLCKLICGASGSKQITHVSVGTGTAPAAAATTLPGECVEANKRVAITSATSASSKTIRFTATFASSASFITTTQTLQNIGLFNSVTTNANAICFAGNTYATSTCATNQNVNTTYDLVFS